MILSGFLLNAMRERIKEKAVSDDVRGGVRKWK